MCKPHSTRSGLVFLLVLALHSSVGFCPITSHLNRRFLLQKFLYTHCMPVATHGVVTERISVQFGWPWPHGLGVKGRATRTSTHSLTQSLLRATAVSWLRQTQRRLPAHAERCTAHRLGCLRRCGPSAASNDSKDIEGNVNHTQQLQYNSSNSSSNNNNSKNT